MTLGPAGGVRATQAPAVPAEAVATVPQTGPVTEEALRAYDQGHTHYDLGEYQAAIEHFRHAYELSRAPALLFNIAQAHRMNKDCPRALDTYRTFLRLTADETLRQEGEEHVRRLSIECGSAAIPAPAPTIPTVAPVPAPRQIPPTAPVLSGPTVVLSAPPAPRSQRATDGVVGLAIGGAALVGAGVLYVWNGRRYEHWRSEDNALTTVDATGDRQSQVDRRQANDDRWRSVQRLDRVTVGLALGAAASLVTGGALLYLGRPAAGARLRVAGTGLLLESRF